MALKIKIIKKEKRSAPYDFRNIGYSKLGVRKMEWAEQRRKFNIWGRPLRDNVKIVLHGSVVIFSILCMLLGFICVLISPIDLSKHTFFTHGIQYMHLFFSLWGSGVQMIYFDTMFAMDIVEIYSINNTKLFKTLHKMKTAVGYLFFTAAFPMSVSISALFWGMYSIDRELIYPKLLDEVYPYWINHSMHTIPAVLVVIYLLFEKHYVPPLKHTLSGIIGILVFYAACILYVKRRDNKWMYYGLHQFNEQQVSCLLTCGAAACIFATLLGHVLDDLVSNWRKYKME